MSYSLRSFFIPLTSVLYTILYFTILYLLSVQCHAYSTGENIKSLYVRWCPSGVRPPDGGCLRDCDVSYGPIFTKFGTQLLHAMQKKMFLKQFDGDSIRACATINRLPLARRCFWIHLKLNISKTVQNSGSVSMEHQQEITYCESNGHVIDDVT